MTITLTDKVRSNLQAQLERTQALPLLPHIPEAQTPML
jgi:hypothetical protein